MYISFTGGKELNPCMSPCPRIEVPSGHKPDSPRLGGAHSKMHACIALHACMHACMHAYRVELFPCACTCQSVCNRLKKYVNDKRIQPLVRNCKLSSCWEDVT